MGTKTLILALTLLACSAPRASAGEAVEDFWDFMSAEAESLTVASPRPESVFNSVSNVIVIDRATIARYNFSSVSEALRTVPGLSVTRTYLMHNVPNIRGALQEHYANKVLVMIDNVPMWNAVTGEGDLDRVGIEAVERIEVLLGPASVLYGSNALTGAVNIVLRKVETDGAYSGLSGGMTSGGGGKHGRLNISQTGGFYAWRRAGRAYSISANSRDDVQPAVSFTDETGNVLSLKEYLNSRSFNLFATSENDSLLVNAYRSEQNYLGNGLSLASGALQDAQREAFVAAYSHAFRAGEGTLKYSAYYDWQRRNIPRDAAGDLRSEIVGDRVSNTLSGVFPVSAGLSLETGAGLEYRRSLRYLNYYSTTGLEGSDNSMSGHSTSESSGYVQLGHEAGPWKLLGGARYTDDSKSGPNLSTRLSAIYEIGQEASLKAMFSQSFRSPTPFEQYFLTPSTTVVGNPGLQPERTETWELSWLASRGGLFVHLTGYYSRHSDSIMRVRGDFTRDGVLYADSNHYENVGDFSSTGIELQARYTAGLTSAFVSLQRMRGDRGDEQTVPASAPLPAASSWNFKYAPDYTASGGAVQGLGDGWFSSGVFNLIGKTRTLRGHIPAQFWGDLTLGHRGARFRHTLAVRNLTDKRVEVPEYVRLRAVEELPLYTGRRFEYTFDYRF